MTGPSTNNLATVSVIAGALSWVALPVVASIAAIITGHMARKEIRRSGEDGDGLAVAGLVLGYSNLLMSCAAIAFVVMIYVGILGAVFATTAVQ